MGYAGGLLTGALRKIAIASYHARELARVIEEGNVYEIALQAHFEGLLYAGVSAEEKLASTLSDLAETESGADTKLLVRRLLSQNDTAELGRLLRDWLRHREMDRTLADEARTLRNLATHHFYDKRGGERGEWHYAAEDRGQYLDGLVLDFSEAYARHVERLEPIIVTVAERWQLELEPAPVEA